MNSAMERKLQEGHFTYFFTKFFVDRAVRNSYRRFQVEGTENIPEDGSTIWAANHTNALMDPLVMLAVTKSQKVFMARADIFQKKAAVKWLRFLKIMPIYRIRDGLEAVKKNTETISQATEIMLDKVPLVIYPEATHRAKHSLLKLSKGVFHITYSVYENSAGDGAVYIQPIGIDYGDYFRFRSTVLVRFGKPFNVSEFIKLNSGDPVPVQMLKMREVLTEKMSELITYIPDDKDYDAIWELTKIRSDNPAYFRKTLDEIESATGSRLRGLMRRQAVNRRTVADLLKFREEQPDEAAKLFEKADRLRVWRIQNGISVYSIANELGWGRVIGKFLLALAGLPYYVFSAVVASVMWIPTLLIMRGIKDNAFYNTARFGTCFAMSIIAFILWTVLYFCFMPWYFALAALLLSLPSVRYLYDYGRFFRLMTSDLRWKFKKRRAPQL